MSALLGVGSYEIKWIGWPGQLVEPHDQHSLCRTLAKDNLHPVSTPPPATAVLVSGVAPCMCFCCGFRTALSVACRALLSS